MAGSNELLVDGCNALILIRATLHVRDSRIKFDLTGTDPYIS
ncbi:MAG: hypothetical protein ACSLEL_04535 [Candidatus Malihini olakiniferum]